MQTFEETLRLLVEGIREVNEREASNKHAIAMVGQRLDDLLRRADYIHEGQHNRDSAGTFEHPQAFIPGLGTVRACPGCGCLVAMGSEHCRRCGEAADLDKTHWPPPPPSIVVMNPQQQCELRLLAAAMRAMGATLIELSEQNLRSAVELDVTIEHLPDGGVTIRTKCR